MGLLDEAIRSHLELKRRHGADPGEVAALEHDALGEEHGDNDRLAGSADIHENHPRDLPDDGVSDFRWTDAPGRREPALGDETMEMDVPALFDGQAAEMTAIRRAA